jgi:hypothetical protein
MAKHPISRQCPKCNGIDFKKVYPDGAIAFTDDRVCKNCGTRYTPPTPLWAAVVFIVVGVFILLVDVAVAGMSFMVSDSCLSFRAGVMLAMILPAGIGCVIYGIRCIRKQDERLPA